MTLWPRQLIEGDNIWASSSRTMVHNGREVMVGGGGQSRKQSASTFKHALDAESDSKSSETSALSKPDPSGMLPPAWPHILRSPKTAPQTGDKMFKYLKLMGDIFIQTMMSIISRHVYLFLNHPLYLMYVCMYVCMYVYHLSILMLVPSNFCYFSLCIIVWN